MSFLETIIASTLKKEFVPKYLQKLGRKRLIGPVAEQLKQGEKNLKDDRLAGMCFSLWR